MICRLQKNDSTQMGYSNSKYDLLIGQEVLLMVYKEKRKKLPLGGWGMFLEFMMPATVLSDLHLLGKISFIGDDRKKKLLTLWVNPIDDTPTGNPILYDVYDVIKNHKIKGKQALAAAAKWMKILGKRMKDLESRMWGSLVQKGIMKQVGRKKYELIKPEVRRELVKRVRATVNGQREPDDRTTEVIGFIRDALGWYMTDIKKRDKKLANRIANRVPMSQILRWNIIVPKK
ncbi:MAG: GOLPH3/VPS74 family protein [Promethearchaeota archaeon]